MKHLFLLLIPILTACSKHVTEAHGSILTVSFDANNQINVSSYKIEVSANGSVFDEAGIIFPTEDLNQKLSIKIDLKDRECNFFRIRTVDRDGKYSTSGVVSVH